MTLSSLSFHTTRLGLAGVQGDITGDILVNGHPKVQATWSRAIGYVEQTDIHSAATTVQEALFFSARMRLPAGNSDQQVGFRADRSPPE